MKNTLQYIKYTFLSAALFCTFSLSAQIWLPLNFQPDKIPVASFADELNYYVCYEDGFAKNGKLFKVAKWNGLVWQRAAPLVLDSMATINSMCTFKGELYLGGKFSTPDFTGVLNIIKLTDSRWSSVNGGAFFSDRGDVIYSMVSSDNGLYVGGEFDTINKLEFKNVAKYDGVGWSNAGSSGTNGVVRELDFINGEVYAVGGFTEIGGVNSKGISKLGKSNWELIGSANFLNSTLICEFGAKGFTVSKIGDKFYFYSHNQNDDWTKNMNGIFYCSEISDLQSFDGKVIAAGKFFFSNNDSSYAAVWDGTQWGKLEGNLHKALNFDVFRKYLMAYGDLVNLQNVNRPIYTARFEPDLVVVKGFVYWDKNANCTFNSEERFLPSERIKLMPSNRYLYTNDKGYFSALINKNTVYTLELETKKHWKVSACANSKVVFKYDETRDQSVVFPLFIEANKKDISVTLSSGSGWKASNGQRQFYKIRYQNLGSVTQNGTINLKFDDRLKNFEAYPAPTFYNAGNVAWKFSDLEVNEKQEISFYVKVDDSEIWNEDELEFTVAGNIDEDIFTEDNVDSLRQEVGPAGTASIFKSIYPEPIGNDSMASIPEGMEFVEFVIHFENENEQPVHTVHVVDTIDLNLSLAHIQELGASHPYVTNVYNDETNPEKGIIVWTFKGIDLEKFDSEGGAENPTFGYISFEMKLKEDNPIGTVFSNTAKVIFDYSNEYVTNTVWGRIIDPSVGVKKVYMESNALEIYPNPCSGISTIRLNNGFNEVQILDALGKVVSKYEEENMVYSKEINFDSLGQGTYFVMVQNDDSKYVKKLIVK